MFDPTNMMVQQMIAQRGIESRNQGQSALAMGTVAQQALWTYDANGRLVMRDIDEAMSIAQGIASMNAKPSAPEAQTLSVTDVVNIVQQVLATHSVSKTKKKKRKA
jgi:hypothetical protein